jgi:hypothetical protein
VEEGRKNVREMEGICKQNGILTLTFLRLFQGTKNKKHCLRLIGPLKFLYVVN